MRHKLLKTILIMTKTIVEFLILYLLWFVVLVCVPSLLNITLTFSFQKLSYDIFRVLNILSLVFSLIHLILLKADIIKFKNENNSN